MRKRESIRSMLSTGRHRLSLGRVLEVVELVREHPGVVRQLLECLWDEDPGLANRAADALERWSAQRVRLEDVRPPDAPARDSGVLDSWKGPLLGLLAEATQNKLRWNLALIVPRLRLSVPECRRAADILRSWLEDPSSIVKTLALQGLADLTARDPSLLPEVLDLLRILGRSGTPAMRARSRHLLRKLERMERLPSGRRSSWSRPVQPLVH